MKKSRFRLLKDEEVREELKKKWIQPRINDDCVVYNINCELCQCRASVSSDTLRCIYCNVVSHQSCFMFRYPKAIVEDMKSWICFYCIEFLDDSRLRYEEEYWELANHERKVQSQIIISKNWRRYKCRSFYVRFYNNVVRLQIAYHVKHRKRDFMLSLQEKLRPIKVRLIKCHNIQVIDKDAHKRRPGTVSPAKDSNIVRKEHHFFFIITVIDFNQGDFNQSWRINSNNFLTHSPPDVPFNLRCDERMMIGGVSGFNTIVITLFQMGSGRNHLIGQVHVELGSNFVWRRGGKFHLNFGPSEFTIKDYGGMDLRADDRTAPCGSLEFEITTYHGMNFECGHCFGTSLEDMLRTLSRLPSYSGFSVETPSSNRQAKKQEGTVTGVSSGSYQFPMKRMWIAVAEGHLYAYSHFGDQLKLSMSLAEFGVNYEFKEGNVVFKLQRNGYPEFCFYTVAVGDTLRWKCAFLASLRYQPPLATVAMMSKSTVPFASAVSNNGNHGGEFSDENSWSHGVMTAPSHPVVPKNFDVRSLVDDLIGMEAKLMTQKGYRQHLASINGMKGMFAYSDGHTRHFGSTDFSAMHQVLDASHRQGITRASVNVSGESGSGNVSEPGSLAARTRSSPDATAMTSPAASPSKTRHGSQKRRISMRPGLWVATEEANTVGVSNNPVQDLWEELEIPELIGSPFSPQYAVEISSSTQKPFVNTATAISSVPHLPNINRTEAHLGERPAPLHLNIKDRPQHGSLPEKSETTPTSASARTENGSVGDPISSRVSGRRPSRRGTGGFDPLFSKEVRDAFSHKIMEENEFDDVVDNTRFQTLGENFVQAMLTSVAKNKLHKVGTTISPPKLEKITLPILSNRK